METLMETVVTLLMVLALLVPFVVLIAHHPVSGPRDPWFPAGHGSWNDGERDPSF